MSCRRGRAYGITRADQFPSVDASASLNRRRGRRRRGANSAIPAGADTDVSYTQAGFSLGWELDVWGRLRRLSEAARAQYLATEEARRGVITTLVADVSETYLALRALDLELEIARRTRDVATDSLRLTEARRTSGVASGLDVRQAEQLLFTATGQIASLEREIAQAENALSLLLGTAAGRRSARPAAGSVPGAADRTGRPSVRAARAPPRHPPRRAGAVAANAQIGAAKAEYFPRISLTGFLGAQSRALSDLLTGPARLASASVGAAAPVFNAGRTRANVQAGGSRPARGARELPAGRSYTAFRDVSDSLAGRTENERAARAAGTAGRGAHANRRSWRRSAIRADWTATCRCSTRSEICFRESSSSRGCASRSCRRSSSSIARSAEAGRDSSSERASESDSRSSVVTRVIVGSAEGLNG